MQKIDLVIGIVGIVALSATALGVVFADDIGGLTEYDFVEVMAPLESQTGAGTAEQSFLFAIPNNSTGATLTLKVTESGRNPIVTGSYTVNFKLEGPKGIMVVEGSQSVASGTGTIEIESLGWADIPESGSYAESALAGMSKVWDQNMKLTISIQGATSAAPLVPNPSYAVEVGGHAHTFVATEATPEVRGA